MMPIPMAMCVQMSDIAIKGNNLNMCMDFVVRLASTELFEMHFQCMKMGLDGIQYVDKDGKPVIPAGSVKINDNDNEYYDETSNDSKPVDEHEIEHDDNIIDNVIEIDDYSTKAYKETMDNQKIDATIEEESSVETEAIDEKIEIHDAEKENATQEESLNEEEQINFGEDKEEDVFEEESQTEVYEVPQPIETIDNESNFTSIEEDIVTTTMNTYDSKTPQTEIITTEFTEINDLETTMPTFTDMLSDIMTDIPTQRSIDKVNETLIVMNNVTHGTSAGEDIEVKNLAFTNQTANTSHENLHAEKIPTLVTSNLSNLVSKEEPTTLSIKASLSTVTFKPKASRMLSENAKKLRKAKAKQKAAKNPITMFRRLFDFF